MPHNPTLQRTTSSDSDPLSFLRDYRHINPAVVEVVTSAEKLQDVMIVDPECEHPREVVFTASLDVAKSALFFSSAILCGCPKFNQVCILSCQDLDNAIVDSLMINLSRMRACKEETPSKHESEIRVPVAYGSLCLACIAQSLVLRDVVVPSPTCAYLVFPDAIASDTSSMRKSTNQQESK